MRTKTARRSYSGRRSTRKAGGSHVTVESLQASFESIDKKIRTLIARGKTDASLLEQLKRAWNEQFHMSPSPAALRGLLQHYRATSSKRVTRKAEKQRGGMAPLDYTMGQGSTDMVYGRFPVEIGTSSQVVRALDMDRFFENPISRGCNSTGGFDAPKQTGGGVFDAAMMGHMPASVPRNVLETTVSATQGHTIANPSPSPVAAHVATVTPSVQPFDTTQISQFTSLAPVFKGF